MTATKTVLVIDDDAESCRQIEEVLTRLGLGVLISSDPRAGLETATSRMPDLIYINLLLPGTNGLKISKAIHAVQGLENVPVIMLISHHGELDPKYTVTIGIFDTLVKPLKEAEIIAKTKALLGDFEIKYTHVETLGEISLEEEINPMIIHEEEEMTGEHASIVELPGESVMEADAEQDEEETMSKMTKEGESDMPDKENLFDRKEDEDRDLFADEADMFGEEIKKSRSDRDKGLELGEDDSFHEDEVDLSYEQEKQASPVRRILIIAASIAVGIGLGVGGYLFFTAGSKQPPVEKQAVKVLPEPVPVPAPAVIPSEKSNVIPEIPVKSEQQKPDAAQTKEAKPHEAPLKSEAKKEPAKTGAGKSGKETAPVAAVQSEEKKPVSPKHAAKSALASVKGKRAYYVQAGLFENEANARAMSDKLKEKGYTPQVKKVEAKDNKVMFRVIAGTYLNFKKAVEVSETLTKQGLTAIVHKQ